MKQAKDFVKVLPVQATARIKLNGIEYRQLRYGETIDTSQIGIIHYQNEWWVPVESSD